MEGSLRERTLHRGVLLLVGAEIASKPLSWRTSPIRT
nr:MAG TPA: hypothetical protein [Caudoviricetes sp.]